METSRQTDPAFPVIRVSDLSVGYGEMLLLDQVSFDVMPGEVFVILGGSGCGKSSLLKNMIGLVEPMGGNIEILGKPFTGVFGSERKAILANIGVAFQNGALFGSMTVLENVMLPLEEYTRLPRAAMETVARIKLGLVGLDRYAHFMPDALSGGMRKRAAIARAMALDPTILFLDEPSAGLDPVTSAGLDRLIQDLSKNLGMTCVIVTHELESIFTIADRVIMLDKSVRNIIATGRPEDLRNDRSNPFVYRFFNRIPESETLV